MLDDKFEYAIKVILRHEGGFVDDKDDRGGATNFGVSLRFLESTGIDINDDGDINVEDIQSLTLDDVKKIYKEYWWDKYDYGKISDRYIATKVFDLSVNMGAHQAAKVVQAAVNELSDVSIAVDGVLGDISYTVINILVEKAKREELLAEIKDEAVYFYVSLAMEKPQFQKYLKGWIARAQA